MTRMTKDDITKEITRAMTKMTPTERKALISFALKLENSHNPKAPEALRR